MKTEEITVRTKVNDVLDGQIRSVTLDAVSIVGQLSRHFCNFF